MVYRVISFQFPAIAVTHIEQIGGIVRDWSTEWRGTVALIGEGRVWAVADLTEVVPAVRCAKYAGAAHCWRFANVRRVEGVECGSYLDGDRYDGEAGPLPKMLDAWAQAALNKLFSTAAPVEPSEPAEPVEPSEPVGPVADSVPGPSNDGAQLLLF